MLYYSVNKGVGKTVTVKGLQAKYLIYAIGAFVGAIVLYVTMRSFLPEVMALGVGAGAGAVVLVRIMRISRTYGRYGMTRLKAARNIPRYVLRRKTYRNLFMSKKREKQQENA